MQNQLKMTVSKVKQRSGGTRSIATTKSVERTKIVESSTSFFDNRGIQTRLRYKSIIFFFVQNSSPNTHRIRKVKKRAQDRLQAPRATMCKGHRHKHAECGHLQWFEAVRRCRDFSYSENACFGHVTTLSTVEVRIPARCNDCFDRAVADIERNCNGCIAAVQAQIEECKSERKDGCSKQRAHSLWCERLQLEKEIKDFKRRRDTDIADLRAEQGM